MRHRTHVAVAAAAMALLLCGSAAVAADGPQPAAAAAKPKKHLEVITPEEVDPARLLPPPAADGSPAQVADLAEVQHIYRERSPERYAQAKWDDQHESPELFAPTLGPAYDLAKLPATARLLKLVQNDADVSADIAKRYFGRNRPWAVDTTIVACDYKPGADPKRSYPSGHATLSYSLGIVLADLIPEKSQAILARAEDYAYSREVCGAHYRSDTEASHVLGSVVAMHMLQSPKVAPMLAAARAELVAAGLTGAQKMAEASTSAH